MRPTRVPFAPPLAAAAVLAAAPWACGQDAGGPDGGGYAPVPRPAPAAAPVPTSDGDGRSPEPPRQFDEPAEAYRDVAGPRPFDAETPLPAPTGDADAPGFREAPEFGRAAVPGPVRPGVDALPGTPFLADSEYGVRPDPGPPGSPAFGLPHRPAPTNRYGIWYRPSSFHAPNRAVYRPSPFRPRGFGNLFDRPCVPDRMDYARYTVRDLPSRYGPTYYPKYRDNTECLVRPTRHYDPGPHAEANTGGCRLGGGCLDADCPDCRGGACGAQSYEQRTVPLRTANARTTAAGGPSGRPPCDCDACRRR